MLFSFLAVLYAGALLLLATGLDIPIRPHCPSVTTGRLVLTYRRTFIYWRPTAVGRSWLFLRMCGYKQEISLFFTYVIPVCFTNTYNFIISHTHQFVIQYNCISRRHVSTVFSHHQALLSASPRLSNMSCTLGSQALIYDLITVHTDSYNS